MGAEFIKFLENQQINALADIVLEEFGPDLTEDELNDRILLILENVAGFEAAPEREVRRVIHQFRSRYYEIIQENREHR